VPFSNAVGACAAGRLDGGPRGPSGAMWHRRDTASEGVPDAAAFAQSLAGAGREGGAGWESADVAGDRACSSWLRVGGLPRQPAGGIGRLGSGKCGGERGSGWRDALRRPPPLRRRWRARAPGRVGKRLPARTRNAAPDSACADHRGTSPPSSPTSERLSSWPAPSSPTCWPT